MSTTTNLADFGYRELDMAADLLKAYANGSGDVFLTNDEYQVIMMNGPDDLEMWYFTPYAGHEGFADDLRDDYERNPGDWDEDDVQYLIDCGIIDGEESES